jgi:hypothetical protein
MSRPSRLGRRGDTRLSLLKKILLSVLVVGVLGTFTMHRAWAVSSADTVDSGTSVASGTLVFTNQVAGQASACSSATAATKDNKNKGCGTLGVLFDASTLRWPGDQSSIRITATNAGSLAGQSLQISSTVAACTSAVSTAAVGHLVGTEGTGDPCGATGLNFYIQETDVNGVATHCLFPSADVGTTDCTANWVAGSLRQFLTKSCWDLGAMSTNTVALSTAGVRYFKIGVEFPPDASNTLQGMTANFPLYWHLYGNTPDYTPACAND